MKKFTALVLSLVLLLSAQVGSVFASSSSSKMDGFIEEAIGTPYKRGGTSLKGFDCSGFVISIFNQMNIDLPRTSKDQSSEGTKVAKDDLQPGDLVFFDTEGKNNGDVTHAGIYVGNGEFAHASVSRGVVLDKLDSNYYKPRYVTARRVMDEDTFTKFATVAK